MLIFLATQLGIATSASSFPPDPVSSRVLSVKSGSRCTSDATPNIARTPVALSKYRPRGEIRHRSGGRGPRAFSISSSPLPLLLLRLLDVVTRFSNLCFHYKIL